MELSIYDMIKRPLITTKTIDLYKKLGQYTFEVHKDINKVMVRNAVEKLWSVEVDKVNIVNLKGRTKLFSRKKYVTPSRKKAIITLKKGYKIEIPGMFESMAAEQPVSAKTEVEEI